MKYTDPSFTVTLGGDAYRDSDIWRDCQHCGETLMGEDSLLSHLREKHHEEESHARHLR